MQTNLEWCKKKLVKFLYSILSRLGVIEKSSPFRRIPPPRLDRVNKWYDWLINHVPKPIKDGASKAFKTFEDKIMALYNRVTGSAGNETRIKEPEPFKPIELEQAFGGSYRSCRVNGRPKMVLIRSLIE